MINNRLRQLRLAKGLSLDGLAAEIDHLVTKQALSKYERGLIRPSSGVAERLAKVLGVKTISLLEQPLLSYKSIAYRSEHGLCKKEKVRVENLVARELEERVRMQNLLQPILGTVFNLTRFRVGDLKDVEEATLQIRKKWNLGLDPIASVTGLLEDRLVHVMEVEVEDKRFDGLSAVAQDAKNKPVAAMVVNRKDVCGERQRLSLLHELAHLVLEVSPGLEPERAAFFFASSFLAPKPVLYQKIGIRRKNIDAEEFLLHKRYFGISIQALLYRLLDLNIINKSYFNHWSQEIGRRGWKTEEPNESPPEEPTWLRRNLLRAYSEGILTRESVFNGKEENEGKKQEVYDQTL